MANWIWIILAIIVVVTIIKVIGSVHNTRSTNTSSTSSSSSITTGSSNTTPHRVTQTTTNTGNSITELGPVNYFANDSHNSPDVWFQFKYKKVGSEWLTYILRMPSLQGRSSDLHSTHRYTNSSGVYWICREPQPDTLEDAQIISRVWADCIVEYIATGRTF